MESINSGVDLDALRRNISGDRDLLAELLNVFRLELPDIRSATAAALRREDGPELARVVHRLRGSLLALGARCSSLAEQLEIGVQGGCTPAVHELAAVLEVRVPEVVLEIETILKSGEL